MSIWTSFKLYLFQHYFKTKPFYIVENIQDVESIRNYFGNKVLIEVVLKNKKEINEEKLKEKKLMKIK